MAVNILQAVPGVTPLQSTELFQSYRVQLNALLGSVSLIMATTWLLAALMLGIVFSVVANERRREMGTLRAIGASRGYIFSSLLAEAGLIGLTGGLGGAVLTILAVYLFRQFIIVTLGIPFLFPAAARAAAAGRPGPAGGADLHRAGGPAPGAAHQPAGSLGGHAGVTP